MPVASHRISRCLGINCTLDHYPTNYDIRMLALIQPEAGIWRSSLPSKPGNVIFHIIAGPVEKTALPPASKEPSCEGDG